MLPVDQKLNASTIRNHLGQVARQVDNQFGVAPSSNEAGRFVGRNMVAQPEGSLVMGVDGGYVRNWNQKKTCFEGAARAGDCWQIRSNRPACKVLRSLRRSDLFKGMNRSPNSALLSY